jgi:WD40 repeat protein
VRPRLDDAAAGRTQPSSSPAVRDDAFISYAREDLDFVRRLREALVARGKKVWVDLEDIPPSADWRAKVFAGIEESKAFVFVLSPGSAASKVCTEELDCALALKKRLVPIVCRRVESSGLRAELKAPNWISFADDGSFEASVETLVQALEADLEWLDAHARYSVLAGDWLRRDRDSSLLLRGGDLRDAEAWLAQSAAQKEAATDTQIGFILAGRRAAGRRRRLLFAAVLVALAVSTGLAIFALFQRSDAIARQHLARSRELAVLSGAQLATDPELAILIARAALDANRTAEAEQALREAILASHVRLRLPGAGNALTAAFRPPRGDLVLTTSTDRKPRLWDAATGALRGVIPTREAFDGGFSPDGRLVWTWSEARTVRLWSVGRMQSTGVRLTASFVSFAPHGRGLLVADRRRAQLVDAYTGRPIWTLEQSGAKVADASLSRDGRFAVVAGIDGTVRVWDVARRTLLRVVETGLNLAEAQLAPDGSSLVVTSFVPGQSRMVLPAHYLTAAYVWSLPSGPRRILHVPGTVGRAYFSPDGSKLVTVGGAVDVWRLRSPPKLLFRVKLGLDDNPSVEFSPDGRLLAVGGTVRDAATGQVLREGSDEGVAHFSPDGRSFALATPGGGAATVVDSGARDVVTLPLRHVVAVGPGGSPLVTADRAVLQLWDAAQLARPRATLHAFRDESSDLAVGAGGDVAYEDANLKPWLWSGVTGAPPHRVAPREIEDIAIADGARVLAAAEPGGPRSGGRVQVWDVRRRPSGASLIAPLAIFDRGIESSKVALSRDGRYLATWSTGPHRPEDGTVTVWDLDRGTMLASRPAQVTYGAGVRFSPDGQTLAIVGDPGPVVLWSWKRDGQRRLDSPHRGVNGAAFSPDGRFVAIVVAGQPQVAGQLPPRPGGIDIWDALTGAEVLWRPAPGLDTVAAAEFAADGTSVVALTQTTDVASHARVFACEVCLSLPELIRLGKRRTTRDFTCAERRQFLNQRCQASR